jgi:hypothetical protein
VSDTAQIAGYVDAENRRLTAANGVEYAYRVTGDSHAPPLVLLQHFRGTSTTGTPRSSMRSRAAVG